MALWGLRSTKNGMSTTLNVKIDGNRETLEVNSDTILKAKPVQSSQLPGTDKVLVKKGTVFFTQLLCPAR